AVRVQITPLPPVERWASPAYASSPENCHTHGCREFKSHPLRQKPENRSNLRPCPHSLYFRALYLPRVYDQSSSSRSMPGSQSAFGNQSTFPISWEKCALPITPLQLMPSTKLVP